MQTIAERLHTLLGYNIVSFTFRKVDGTIRHAIGTRNLDLARRQSGEHIPTPKGEEQPNSYFDLDKMAWRSYKPQNLISIDAYVAKPASPAEIRKGIADFNDFLNGTEPKKEREIPISKPMGGGADIDKFGIGGLFGGMFGIPKEEIRKTMDDLDKDIVIGNPPYGKVGTPTATERGIALPLGEISVEDFAKMVAHYAVEEFISRIKQL